MAILLGEEHAATSADRIRRVYRCAGVNGIVEQALQGGGDLRTGIGVLVRQPLRANQEVDMTGVDRYRDNQHASLLAPLVAFVTRPPALGSGDWRAREHRAYAASVCGLSGSGGHGGAKRCQVRPFIWNFGLSSNSVLLPSPI
jgi:hypothetical protein